MQHAISFDTIQAEHRARIEHVERYGHHHITRHRIRSEPRPRRAGRLTARRRPLAPAAVAPCP